MKKIGQRAYAACSSKYPGLADVQLEKKLGVSRGIFSKMRNDRTPGVNVIKKLVEQFPEYSGLLQEAEAETERRRTRGHRNAAQAKIEAKIRRDLMKQRNSAWWPDPKLACPSHHYEEG
jgi:hypothetical protein